MKTLLLLALLVPSIASAELIPPGCYVQDSERTNPCYEPGASSFEWLNPSLNSNQTMADNYGEVMSYVLRVDYTWRQYGAQQAEAFRVQKAVANLYLRQIKKLRKACGKKCNKIH